MLVAGNPLIPHLRTITTLDRFGLGYLAKAIRLILRMLQPLRIDESNGSRVKTHPSSMEIEEIK